MIGKTRRTKLSKKTTRVSKTQKKHKKRTNTKVFYKILRKMVSFYPLKLYIYFDISLLIYAFV